MKAVKYMFYHFLRLILIYFCFIYLIGKAYVKDARNDSCSRNVFRYPHLADAVALSRVRDHFVFTVESVGALEPEDIFLEAVKCLKKKCQTLLEEMEGSK